MQKPDPRKDERYIRGHDAAAKEEIIRLDNEPQ